MAQQIHTDINTVVMASGYNLLAAGCIGPFGMLDFLLLSLAL